MPIEHDANGYARFVDHPQFDAETHDAHMKLAPVEYRGYSIRPLSHRHQPYYIDGRFVFFGFVVIKDHCNIMPGGTWFRSVLDARTAIDVLEEVGPRPSLYARFVSREEQQANTNARYAWSQKFWSMLRERI